MDQRRHLSQFSNPTMAASSFSEELRLPTERQVGFWKPDSLPHHIGSKSVASSPIEKPQPIGTKTVGRVDLQAYKLRDQKAAFSLEHKIFGQERHVNLPPSLWRADQDPNRQSDSSLFPDGRRTNPNEAYNENGLFSSSLSEIFDKKRETLYFSTCIYLTCFLEYARELSIIALRSTKHLQDTN